MRRTSRGSAGDETRLVPVYATFYSMLVGTYSYMMSGIELTTHRKRALTDTYIKRLYSYMRATRYNYPSQYIKVIRLRAPSLCETLKTCNLCSSDCASRSPSRSKLISEPSPIFDYTSPNPYEIFTLVLLRLAVAIQPDL